MPRFANESFDGLNVQVADNLREVVLSVEGLVAHERDLLRSISVRIGPAAERQSWFARANLLAQLPRMLDAARPSNAPVPPEHDERRKSMLPCLFGIREAEFDRMLRG